MKAAFLRFEPGSAADRVFCAVISFWTSGSRPAKDRLFHYPMRPPCRRFRDALLFTAHNLFGRKIPIKHRRGAGHKKKAIFFKTISTSKQQIAPNVRMSGYRKSNLRPFSYPRPGYA
jgi:hypothetical protein